MRRFNRRVVVWLNYKGALRIVAGVSMVLITALLLTQEMPVSRTWTYWTLPLSGKTIAIDAGHGGVDGGAVSKQGVIEKDLNLAIALYLRDYLQQAGAIVIMTRETDNDLADTATRPIAKRKTEDLLKRVQFVKEHDANMLVSIHMNSMPSARWKGAQTFYYPNHPDNRLLATLIQEEIKRNLENTNRVASKVNTVYLLRALDDIPAALVEVGFLSNPGEAERLADAEYQRQVAASIYQGILRYSAGEKLEPDPPAQP
ncbi:N-acetylmuramoyl-L-alanine amidase [Paenibacillus sp. 32O-W]|uniref:N-acetylmuramoyl-L-alanine amidase CwlD n=1 Tax=Paenibacillus sp. 32O-W TaxID=1695218 RepID=UPI000722E8F9|nr:N-acetylmuramoyl-L-alanine amidase CwlD [Paenibacillus sp. 32O-W]ALS26208.1 N-acetylmuramoyl-L-alanine amidase [Paenibacillus sp. 32O-W]